MGADTGRKTAFSLVIRTDEVRVRKAAAPPARPMQDRRCKAPRRKPDLLADE